MGLHDGRFVGKAYHGPSNGSTSPATATIHTGVWYSHNDVCSI